MTYDDDRLVAPGTERSVYRLATQSVVHGLVASASPENLLEMKIPCSHTRPIKSEPPRGRIQESAFGKQFFLAII